MLKRPSLVITGVSILFCPRATTKRHSLPRQETQSPDDGRKVLPVPKSAPQSASAGLPQLQRIPSLRELNISQTVIDDAAVATLTRLRSLERLQATETRLTESAPAGSKTACRIA